MIIQITHGLLFAAAKETLNSGNRPGFHNLNRQDDQWLKEHGFSGWTVTERIAYQALASEGASSRVRGLTQ
jgi:hypothetical protein